MEYFFELFASAVFFAFASRTVIYWHIIAALSGIILLVAITNFGSVLGFGFSTAPQFFLGFFRILYPFSIGILIFHNRNVLSRISIHAALPITFLIILLSLPISLLSELVIIGMGVPLAVLLGANATAGKAATLFGFLGALSYPFYAINMAVFSIIIKIRFEVSGLTVVAGLTVAVGLSWLLLVYFDEPVRRWLGQRVRSPATKVKAA